MKTNQRPRLSLVLSFTFTALCPALFGANAFAIAPQAAQENAKARGAFEKQAPKSLPMFVTKTAWTEQDELNWQLFVTTLGQARANKKCNTVQGCLQSREANIYAKDDPPGLILYADCAELPYLLRSYFAYHNGLPFGHVTEVAKNAKAFASQQDQEADLVTSRLDNDPYGNIIVSRGGSNVPSAPGHELNYLKYLIRAYDGVSTRSFRVGPLSPNYNLSDVYPVRMDRGGIGPGTVVHSTGHALVVWKVDEKGVIHVIDGHPDNSMQFKTLDASTLQRSRPDQALGFFRFRPLRLQGAQLAANAAYYGGVIVTEADGDLFRDGKYSLDQWFGLGSNLAPGATVAPDQWKKAFSTGGGFFNTLAGSLRNKEVILQADEEVSDRMKNLCDQLQQRVPDVATAVKAGVTQMAHPDSLPADVFGEEERQVWGPYATNNRDARLKAAAQNIVKDAIESFRAAKAEPTGAIRFAGTPAQFVKSLLGRLAAMDKQCAVKYRKSNGQVATIPFARMVGRLNRISFDPYLCPEKRWGAGPKELASCEDGDSDHTWYRAEFPMYNTLDKTNEDGVAVIRSDRPIDLDMLGDRASFDQPDASPVNLGALKTPTMDLGKLISSPNFLRQLSR